MLLPDKHISVAESILGLGAFILEQLDKETSVDRLYELTTSARETKALPAYHDFDSIVLAILFLYSIGTVDLTDSGMVRRCAS
ncbi:MAG: ABC-three component system middle component 6 [Phycisphaerales bacterium]